MSNPQTVSFCSLCSNNEVKGAKAKPTNCCHIVNLLGFYPLPHSPKAMRVNGKLNTPYSSACLSHLDNTHRTLGSSLTCDITLSRQHLTTLTPLRSVTETQKQSGLVTTWIVRSRKTETVEGDGFFVLSFGSCYNIYLIAVKYLGYVNIAKAYIRSTTQNWPG